MLATSEARASLESKRLARAGAIPFLTRRQTALFAASVVLVLLIGNATTSLWDQDEAAYAGFARTMLRTGDWVVPHFTWSEVHRKTPLLFWCIAASFTLFGENEFALRLPTALAVLLTLGSVAVIGGPVFGRRVARLAAAILAATLFLPNLGKVAVTDSLVLLFETLAALAVLRLLDGPPDRRAWRWTLLFWAAVGLGALAKGPVVLIFAGGLGGWLAAFHPRRRQLLLGLRPWLFLPLALLPVLAWGWLAWRQTDGELIRWMYDWYVKDRATRAVYHQAGPPGYYLASFFATMLPWALFLPAALVRVWQHRREPVYCVLAGWLFSGWVVWEFAASKLPTYAVGAYPAFALLFAAEVLDRRHGALWNRRSVRLGVFLSVVLSVVCSAGLLAGALFLLRDPRLALAAALPAALLVVVPVWAMRRLRAGGGDVRGAVRVLLFGPIAVLLSAWLLLVPRLEPLRALAPRIARVVEAEAPPGAEVVLGGNFMRPSLPFYLGRIREPAVLDEAAVADRVRRPDARPLVLVLSEDGYARVRRMTQTPEWRAIRVAGFNLDKGRECTFWVLVREPPSLGRLDTRFLPSNRCGNSPTRSNSTTGRSATSPASSSA
jgi:4-amino-4-deoxy-L-arabinose transferase-like glycosyltransferase